VTFLLSRFNILPAPPITPKTKCHIPKAIRRAQEKEAKKFSTMPSFAPNAHTRPPNAPLSPLGVVVGWAREALERLGGR
jgi:hypothetical protein